MALGDDLRDGKSVDFVVGRGEGRGINGGESVDFGLPLILLPGARNGA